MTHKTISAQKLFESLQKEEFKRQSEGAEISGMAKIGKKSKTIEVAPFDCETWVKVPLDLIKDAEILAVKTCNDHTHPVVRIRLQSSGKKTREAVKKIKAKFEGRDRTKLALARILKAVSEGGGQDVPPEARAFVKGRRNSFLEIFGLKAFPGFADGGVGGSPGHELSDCLLDVFLEQLTCEINAKDDFQRYVCQVIADIKSDACLLGI